MSVVLQRAVVDVLREAGAIRLAVDAGKDPGAAIAGLQSARAVVRNQISFMPVRDDPGVDALRKFITARDAQLEILLRSEEHTSELQSLMRISYAVFCLKKKTY